MFFDNLLDVKKIASRCGTSVFVVPTGLNVEIGGAFVLQPENKSVITIEQVRNVIARLGVRQTSDVFIVIRPAESLQIEAANALLKSLEEPGEKVHFVLITDSPSQILSTILSRASLYFLRDIRAVDGPISASDKVKVLAKKLMVAREGELVELAEEISRKKEGVKAYALEVIGVAIEMLYKTYFLTGKDAFLSKLPKFVAAYEAISRNGHVKLQIVANLC